MPSHPLEHICLARVLGPFRIRSRQSLVPRLRRQLPGHGATRWIPAIADVALCAIRLRRSVSKDVRVMPWIHLSLDQTYRRLGQVNGVVPARLHLAAVDPQLPAPEINFTPKQSAHVRCAQARLETEPRHSLEVRRKMTKQHLCLLSAEAHIALIVLLEHLDLHRRLDPAQLCAQIQRVSQLLQHPIAGSRRRRATHP